MQEGVAAVERAIAIAEAFTEEDASLSLSDLATRTGLYKSTVLRLVNTWVRNGYMVRLDDGNYRLGPMLLRLGNIYQRSFRLEDHVMPVLRKLSRDTGESASFYIREGRHRLCLFRVNSQHLIRHHVQAGDLLPINEGATGQVLVHYEKSKSPKRALPIITVGVGDPDSVGMAVPVFGNDDRLAGAMALSGPKSRFSKVAQKAMAVLLLRAGENLTIQLSGRRMNTAA